MKVNGWAIVDKHGIDIRTVCALPRAAKINWLCVNHGMLITIDMADGQIEALWLSAKGDADCIEITVTEGRPGPL